MHLTPSLTLLLYQLTLLFHQFPAILCCSIDYLKIEVQSYTKRTILIVSISQSDKCSGIYIAILIERTVKWSPLAQGALFKATA